MLFCGPATQKISSSMKSINLKVNTKNNVPLLEFIWLKLRLLSSGKWHPKIWQIGIKGLEESDASTFRVEEQLS